MSAQEKSADGYEVVWRDYCVKHKVVPADAIVTERVDVPTYAAWEVELLSVRDEAHAREMAISYLAAAEHLRTHPPVDEAEVQRLAHTITGQQEHFGCADGWDFMDLARRLYLAGVRAPEVTK